MLIIAANANYVPNRKPRNALLETIIREEALSISIMLTS